MFVRSLTDTAELRPLEPWQAAEFAEFVDRARDHLTPWLPWVAGITDTGTARSWLQDYADKQARDEGRIYGIWSSGVLCGGLVFRTFDSRLGVCEIGVWLSPDTQGQGLVNRAARQLIDWAFTVRGMDRIEWLALAGNSRSIAAAERLGMTHEGTMREFFPYRGVRHDCQLWSLLRHEYESWPAGRAPEGSASAS